MQKNSKHSIVLTVYNAYDDVHLCLLSLEKSLEFHTTELIIIDDCSKDETRILLQEFAQKYPIHLYRHEENKGYLYSINEGLSYATGDIITLLNSDTTIPTHFTSRILACFEARKQIGIASPILASGNPFSIPYPKISPLEIDSMDIKIRAEIPDYPAIVFPDGACFSIHRKCYEKIGFFDTLYGQGYFEEVDYCMRAYEAGFDTVLIDNVYVYHKSHASFGKRETQNRMKKNKHIFMKKWGDKYTILHNMFPKKEHKKRLFLKFYSYPYFLFHTTMYFLTKCIPFPKVRRDMRKKYQ